VQRVPAAAHGEAATAASAIRAAPALVPAVTAPPSRVVVEPRAVEGAPPPLRFESLAVAPVTPATAPHASIDLRAPAALAPPAASVERKSEPPPARPVELSRIVEIVREERTVVESAAERRGPGPAPFAASIEPAPLWTQPRVSEELVREVPEAERPVHVRIGAIEIHAAEPERAAASVPAPPPPIAPAGGFDEFARLRSYAPWGW
jgi:hypothetical protein